jgi:hypothetical protein
MTNFNQHDAFKDSIKRLEEYKAHQIVQYYISETIKLSIITGPLYNLSTNLQFVNRNLAESRMIMNDTKETILKLKNIPKESIIRPFKPSIYTNYRDCVFNLYRQGIAGLYKGTFYRLSYFGATNLLKKKLDGYFSSYIQIRRVFKEIILYSIADFIMNPLLLIESRYCIQNSRKNFRIYDNIFTLLKTSWKELYNGSLYAIPRNIILVSCLNIYILYPSTYMNIFSVSLAHLLSYPILTVQRNIMFQSNYTDYLPNAAENKITIRSFYNDYGILGFYRGFLAYGLATLLWHIYVPIAAKKKLFDNMFKKDDDKPLRLNLFEDSEEYDSD